MYQNTPNVTTKRLSENYLVNYFTSNQHGMVFGYAMYNQLMLTTQIGKHTHIYTSIIDSDEIKMGSVVLHRCDIEFTDDVVKTIQMLEIFKNVNKIEDLDPQRLRTLCNEFFIEDVNSIINKVLLHLNYPESVVDALCSLTAINKRRIA